MSMIKRNSFEKKHKTNRFFRDINVIGGYLLLSLLSNKDASFVLVIHKDYQQQQQQNEKVDREYKTNKQTKNIGFYPIKMVIIMIIMMVVVVVKEFLDNFFGSDSNNYYETNKKFVKTFSFSLLK